jgi:hypothetical protein
MLMLRRVMSVVLAIVALTSVAGCSKTDPSGLQTLPAGGDGSTGGSPPSSTPTSAATPPPASRTPDGKGHDVFPGRVVASTAEAKSVAAIWLGFWRVRMSILNAAKMDADALSRQATGAAITDMVGYVGYLSKSGLRVQGDVRVGLDAISVKGAGATARSCINDWSTEVNAKGVPKAPATRFVQLSATFVKIEGEWRVSRVAISSRLPCQA